MLSGWSLLVSTESRFAACQDDTRYTHQSTATALQPVVIDGPLRCMGLHGLGPPHARHDIMASHTDKFRHNEDQSHIISLNAPKFHRLLLTSDRTGPATGPKWAWFTEDDPQSN